MQSQNSSFRLEGEQPLDISANQSMLQPQAQQVLNASSDLGKPGRAHEEADEPMEDAEEEAHTPKPPEEQEGLQPGVPQPEEHQMQNVLEENSRFQQVSANLEMEEVGVPKALAEGTRPGGRAPSVRRLTVLV